MRRAGWLLLALLSGCRRRGVAEAMATPTPRPLTVATAPDLRPETQKRDAEGVARLEAKDYSGAISAFREAIAADDENGRAHYHLARALGTMRQIGWICEFDASRGRMVRELTRAVELDPTVKTVLTTDLRLEPIRDTWGYLVLAGLDP